MTIEREHSIDTVRAVAIAGVVGGHWLVTGLVVDDDGAWRQASPLAAMPGFVPVSWVLQTLGLFFFAGGFAAAAARRSPSRTAAVVRRLGLAVGGLAVTWSMVLGIAALLGTPVRTVRTIAVLVVSPLWFLLPYVLLLALTPTLIRCLRRAGPLLATAPAVGVVAASDARLAPSWIAVPAAWAVPWILGIALAQGRLRAGAILVVVGAGGMVTLVQLAGYPASAVGVPGDGRSNLDPPSLFAVALAVAQIGVFLLIRTPRSARTGGLVVSLNRAALPVYLGHQSVLVIITAAATALLGAPAPGLLTAPTGPAWVVQRLAWLPLLAIILAAATAPRWWTTRRAQRD
jgi:hypothetical protein